MKTLNIKNYKNSEDLINERNIVTIEVKLQGFEEVNKQLDILIGKCKKLNKVNATCSINNKFFVDNDCNIDKMAKELSEKLRLCVMKND